MRVYVFSGGGFGTEGVAISCWCYKAAGGNLISSHFCAAGTEIQNK